MSGAVSYHAGLAAEDAVARHYVSRGSHEIARRWRGRSGEIDLILREGDGIVFVEVKKSRDAGRAAARVSPRQIARILSAAEEFVAGERTGTQTDMRFDVACVDAMGRVAVIQGAFP